MTSQKNKTLMEFLKPKRKGALSSKSSEMQISTER